MALPDDLEALADEAGPAAELVRAQLKIAKRDRRILELEAAVRATTKHLDEARRVADFGSAVLAGERPPPRWLTPTRRAKTKRHATVVLMLSDLHFDEVVDAGEMHGLNAYNRAIAEARFTKVIETTVELVGSVFPTMRIDGAVVLWAGDVFSGLIHEELRETNAAPVLASVVHYQPLVAGAFTRLAEAFGRLHVAVVTGNHGRLTLKPKAKGRAEDSLEWLFAHNVARTLAGDRRITFDIPTSFDTMVGIYGTKIRLEHGDAFRGGSGIAGAMSPLLLGVHRRSRAALAEGDARRFDVMAMGHWHQLIHAPSKGLLVNGSLIGPNEYSTRMGFESEPPQQAFFLVTPEHGIAFSAPIFAADRAAEAGLAPGW